MSLLRFCVKKDGEVLDEDATSTNHSPSPRNVLCLFNIHSTSTKVKKEGSKISARVMAQNTYRNAKRTRKSVMRYSVVQILLGALVFAAQCQTFVWNWKVQSFNTLNLSLSWELNDFISTGMWVGAYMVFTGFMGLMAARKCHRGWVITHLVVNVLAVGMAIALTVIPISDVGTLVRCKTRGIGVENNDLNYGGSSYNNNNNQDYRYYYYGKTSRATTTSTTTTPTTTTIAPEVDVFGETLYLNIEHQRMFCTDVMFTAWIILELVMIVSSLVMIGISITLIVKNSKALCMCCLRCCAADEFDVLDEKDDGSVLIL